MYEMIKDRPMPARDKYRLRGMSIGDSFDFPETERATIRAAITYAHKKTGFHYAVRRVDEKTLGCWRVAEADDQAENT